MEGQGMASTGAPGESGARSVVAAEFHDPGASHVTNAGEGQERNGDDTVVIAAQGHLANGDPADPDSPPDPDPRPGVEPRAAQPSPVDPSVPSPALAAEPPTVVTPAIPAEPVEFDPPAPPPPPPPLRPPSPP